MSSAETTMSPENWEHASRLLKHAEAVEKAIQWRTIQGDVCLSPAEAKMLVQDLRDCASSLTQ